MADIDLDAILAKRAEVRGDDGTRFSFSFAGTEWNARDPQLLSDDEKDELAADVGESDIDVAAWFMGNDQYDTFLEAGGSSSIYFQAMRAYMDKVQGEIEGKPTQPNRSSRRSASKRVKQH